MDRPEHLPKSLEQLADHPSIDLGAAITSADPPRDPTWLVGLLLVAVPSQALAIWRVLGEHPAGTRPPLRDSIIFEYIGWYLTQGARLYVDVWDRKPPLPYEVTAAVSLLAGGDPVLTHWPHVALTSGAAVGTVVMVGVLVAALAAISVVTMGGFGLDTAMVYQPGPVVYKPHRTIELPYTMVDRAHLFWNQQPPETCRVFYGPTQHQLVQGTTASPFAGTCGDAEPVLHGLRLKWFGG